MPENFEQPKSPTEQPKKVVEELSPELFNLQTELKRNLARALSPQNDEDRRAYYQELKKIEELSEEQRNSITEDQEIKNLGQQFILECFSRSIKGRDSWAMDNARKISQSLRIPRKIENAEGIAIIKEYILTVSKGQWSVGHLATLGDLLEIPSPIVKNDNGATSSVTTVAWTVIDKHANEGWVLTPPTVGMMVSVDNDTALLYQYNGTEYTAKYFERTYPTIDNKGMTSSVTTGDGTQAVNIPVSKTPSGGSYIEVLLNGVQIPVEDTGNALAFVTSVCYFSSDGGLTSKLMKDVKAGDITLGVSGSGNVRTVTASHTHHASHGSG